MYECYYFDVHYFVSSENIVLGGNVGKKLTLYVDGLNCALLTTNLHIDEYCINTTSNIFYF